MRTPFFLKSGDANIFCVFFKSSAESVGKSVLIVPPFAEEMNRVRPMLRRQAESLAERGANVLLPDLFGTGDSCGNFEKATWDLWSQNLRDSLTWLRMQSSADVTLLAVRFGALLGAELCAMDRRIHNMVCWQPQLRGSDVMNQFIRMALVNQFDESKSRTNKSIRDDLENDVTHEIAGYPLSGDLYKSIIRKEFTDLCQTLLSSIDILQVTSIKSDNVPRSLTEAATLLREKNVDVVIQSIAGKPFWNTVEVETIPELLRTTTELIVGQI